MKSKKGSHIDISKCNIDEFPVGLFHKILQTGDLGLLGGVRVKYREDAWANLFDGYIKSCGLSETYKQYLELKSEAIDYYFKSFINGDKHFETMAEVKERQAEAIAAENQSADFDTLAASVSKFMGFRIDTMEVSIKEFYSYVELMQASIKNHGRKEN